jgi:hypothetical protein
MQNLLETAHAKQPRQNVLRVRALQLYLDDRCQVDITVEPVQNVPKSVYKNVPEGRMTEGRLTTNSG